MASKQVIPYGGKVERSDDGTTAWEAIPEVKGLAIPTVTKEYPEVTNLDSPDGYREYIPGLKDAGEITIPCGYTEAGYAQQTADEASGVAIFYKVTLPKAAGQTTSGDTFEFQGFPVPSVEGGDIGAPVNMNVVLRVTGAVEWTAGT
jgi:hypothetical protein